MAAQRKNRYDTAHLKNIATYQRQIADIYSEAVREAALIGTSVPNVSYDKVFSFADYPITTRRINTLLENLQRNITTIITNGITAEWALSNEKNDELVNTTLGQTVRTLTAEQRRQYFSNNDSALQAFSKRKVNGMNLSDRVWKYTNQFKSEIELGIDIGLREGRSAQQLSRDLRGYLKQPDKLFRRVRDEYGNLVLSRRAAAYHPGQGVYRSSYKNAIRMTGTETNMAYRMADHTRWQQLDFVVGQEIHTSNNHTLNGEEFEDMCDELAGKYPKDFEFTGWHPNCRCYAASILKSREEMREDNRRIMNGEEPLPAKDSVNYVPSVPKGFTYWVVANKDRIAKAKSMPYFIKDNQDLVDKILKEATQPKTLKNLDDVIKRFQYNDPDLKAREDEINAKMKKLFEDNDYGMDIDPKNLESMYDKGFLNQFETGTSDGYILGKSTQGLINETDPRLIASTRMFFNPTDGTLQMHDNLTQDSIYTGTQLARSEYEKYGHLLDHNKARSYTQNVTQYGGKQKVQVRFKKDEVNATWTFSDSLMASREGKYYQPSLVNDPKVESFDDKLKSFLSNHYGTVDKFLNSKDWNNLSKLKSNLGNLYFEMQYSGKLTIDHVESLTFYSHPINHISQDLIDKLSAKGIEMWYMDNGKAVRYKP